MIRPIMVGFFTLFLCQIASSEKLWVENTSGNKPLVELPTLDKIVARIMPAVVGISVEQSNQALTTPDNPLTPLYELFGQRAPEQSQQGIGTGFIINPAGYILTNSHVVEKAGKIRVYRTTSDDEPQKTYQATVIGLDPRTDVALLKIEGEKPLPFVPLGDSNTTNIGTWVLALGNPYNLGHSASIGIVSAKERRDIKFTQRSGLYDFIQTDVSIHPGNSGGPLCNLRGEAVGVNAAINAVWPRIGFAIPINMVKQVLPQLKQTGYVKRGWLGILVQTVDQKLAEALKIGKPRGAIITEVISRSPAEQAGLQPGDVVLAFNGRTVRDGTDVRLLAAKTEPGQMVRIKYVRKSQTNIVDVALGHSPQSQKLALTRRQPQRPPYPQGKLGFTVVELDQVTKARWQIQANQGVVVKEVEEGSPAHEAGLLPGDLILELDGETISSVNQLAQHIHKETTDHHLLRIRRFNQGVRYVVLPKPH